MISLLILFGLVESTPDDNSAPSVVRSSSSSVELEDFDSVIFCHFPLSRPRVCVLLLWEVEKPPLMTHGPICTQGSYQVIGCLNGHLERFGTT